MGKKQALLRSGAGLASPLVFKADAPTLFGASNVVLRFNPFVHPGDSPGAYRPGQIPDIKGRRDNSPQQEYPENHQVYVDLMPLKLI